MSITLEIFNCLIPWSDHVEMLLFDPDMLYHLVCATLLNFCDHMTYCFLTLQHPGCRQLLVLFPVKDVIFYDHKIIELHDTHMFRVKSPPQININQ